MIYSNIKLYWDYISRILLIVRSHINITINMMGKQNRFFIQEIIHLFFYTEQHKQNLIHPLTQWAEDHYCH